MAERIVIAEDDEDLAFVLREALHPQSVRGGDRALRRARSSTA